MGGGANGHDRLVSVIGVFKLMKASVLAPLGVAMLMGLPAEIARSAVHSVRWTGALSGHMAVRAAVSRLLALNHRDLREIGVACLAYAAVFVVEGVGLLRGRRWAEWLTVVVTASFIPFEIWELTRRLGGGKVVALAVNAAIVVYLAWRRVRAEAPRVSRFRPA